jgi:hypothetical protein
MLSMYEMEATMETLEADRPSLQLEALEERLAPWGCYCYPLFGAAAATSTSAAAAVGGGAAAAASSSAAAAAGGGAAAAVGASAGVAVAI